VADHFELSVGNEKDILEQNELSSTSGISHTSKELCKFLTNKFPIQMVCITLGSKGALIYQNGGFTHHFGYKVQVEDTVGAGDAFLSGFVKTYLEGKNPKEILDFSCALGAFVATKKGGTPKYEIEEVRKTVGKEVR
jgi:fructokinase